MDTEDDLLTYLGRQVAAAGSQKAFAERISVSAQYLGQVLKRRRRPGKKLLEATGVVRQVVYYLPHGTRPPIITMCGSSRFCGEMAVKRWQLERDEGAITLGLHLLPSWYTEVDGHLAEAEGCAAAMDELHLRKIDLSDEIYVMNVEGYVGDSTRREIEYAKAHGKNVRWFEPEHAF